MWESELKDFAAGTCTKTGHFAAGKSRSPEANCCVVLLLKRELERELDEIKVDKKNPLTLIGLPLKMKQHALSQ